MNEHFDINDSVYTDINELIFNSDSIFNDLLSFMNTPLVYIIIFAIFAKIIMSLIQQSNNICILFKNVDGYVIKFFIKFFNKLKKIIKR